MIAGKARGQVCSWLLVDGEIKFCTYLVDPKLDNQVNSLLLNEGSLPPDMVFDRIPNVGILKALWTAQSDLMPAKINKSQEQT